MIVYPEFGGLRIYTSIINFLMQENISASLLTHLWCYLSKSDCPRNHIQLKWQIISEAWSSQIDINGDSNSPGHDAVQTGEIYTS
jgi:hypothetical protein